MVLLYGKFSVLVVWCAVTGATSRTHGEDSGEGEKAGDEEEGAGAEARDEGASGGPVAS